MPINNQASNEKKPLLSPKNALVKAIKDSEYIKNPLVYSQIRGNFSLLQGSVMLSVIKKLQGRIIDQINNKSFGLLFTDEEIQENILTFDINLKELGIDKRRYDVLPSAMEALVSMHMTYQYKDEKTGENRESYQNIFHSIDIPYATESSEGESLKFKGGERRKGNIIIKMHQDSAKKLLTMTSGYVEHLGNIFRLCKSPRTARMYIYLSAWRQAGECTGNYLDLKEYLGLLEFNSNRTQVVNDVYPKYGNFARDVLKPAQRDMKKLCDTGQLEFYYEFEPVYATSVKRGDPLSIKFTLVNGTRGELLNASKRFGKLQSTLITKWQFNDSQWEEIEHYLNDSMIDDCYKEIKAISSLIEKNQPDDVTAYAFSLFLHWLKEENKKQQIAETYDEVETIEEEKKEIIIPEISAPTQKKWNDFIRLLKENNDISVYNFWASSLKIWSYESKMLKFLLPNTFFAKELNNRFHTEIEPSLVASFGSGLEIAYIINEELFLKK